MLQNAVHEEQSKWREPDTHSPPATGPAPEGLAHERFEDDLVELLVKHEHQSRVAASLAQLGRHAAVEAGEAVGAPDLAARTGVGAAQESLAAASSLVATRTRPEWPGRSGQRGARRRTLPKQAMVDWPVLYTTLWTICSGYVTTVLPPAKIASRPDA